MLVQNQNSEEILTIPNGAGAELVSQGDLVTALRSGLDQSRFVEVIVPNRPENIELQRRLLGLPVVSLGVFPGGEFIDINGNRSVVETTIHFGITRPETARRIVEVECASDYKDSPLQGLTHRVRDDWRELANA